VRIDCGVLIGPARLDLCTALSPRRWLVRPLHRLRFACLRIRPSRRIRTKSRKPITSDQRRTGLVRWRNSVMQMPASRSKAAAPRRSRRLMPPLSILIACLASDGSYLSSAVPRAVSSSFRLNCVAFRSELSAPMTQPLYRSFSLNSASSSRQCRSAAGSS
jgi:hypothetical protein